MQEEYHAKGNKFYVCLVDLEKAFDRASRKVLERAIRKKEIPEVLVRSVMSLYEGKKKIVSVEWTQSCQRRLRLKLGCHKLNIKSQCI